MPDDSAAKLTSLKGKVSAEEWQARVDLAALYRLVALHGWDDLIYTHISARIPGPEHHFLINPYGMLFEEITASSLVKIDLEGNILQETPYFINPAGFTIHSAIHDAREDARFVMHLHSDQGVARRGPGACARHIVEQPGEFRPGEIGVDQQSRDLCDVRLRPLPLQAFARRSGAAVLPDDRAVDRLARGPIPDDHRLALVGDADRGHIGDATAGPFHGLAHDRDAGLEDLDGVVLDPPVGGIVLGQRPARLGHRPSLQIEEDGAGAGGALVQGHDQRLGHAAFPPEAS